MKSCYALVVSALFEYAIAGQHNAHQVYHNKLQHLAPRGDNATCGCTTYYTTITGPGTLIQDIQPNTTTTHITITEHIKVTVVPEANTATSAPSAEITSHASPSPKSYAQASSPNPASAPIESEVPSSASANSPINASPKPAAELYKAAAKPGSSAENAAPKPKVASHPVKQAPAPKPKIPAPAPQHAPAPIASGGNQWCMTYSPYTASGGCKSASAVSSDVAAIASKGFSSIRLYSTDCSGLQNVGSAASSHGLKLVLGVFISESGIGAAQEQVSEITQWAEGQWENVEMIVIGNEAVFNGYCTAAALAGFVSSAKTTLQKAGYPGLVTTTEPLNVLQEYAATLCPVMDVASANIHPFFNADVEAANAGQFVATELRLLATVCPGKETYNLETGWPNQGQANGAACPGIAEQKEAIQSIKQMAGGKSAFFSFEDDLWKAEGALGVERSWGCSQLFVDH